MHQSYHIPATPAIMPQERRKAFRGRGTDLSTFPQEPGTVERLKALVAYFKQNRSFLAKGFRQYGLSTRVAKVEASRKLPGVAVARSVNDLSIDIASRGDRVP